MKIVLFKAVLWLISVIRAAVITAGLATLYTVIYVVWFDGDFSKTEEILVPCIGAALLFLGLTFSSTPWVNSYFEDDK